VTVRGQQDPTSDQDPASAAGNSSDARRVEADAGGPRPPLNSLSELLMGVFSASDLIFLIR